MSDYFVSKFSERQTWDVLRTLVSENTNEIRKVYSGAVYGRLYPLYQNRPKQELIQRKNEIVSEGIREIYIGIGEKLTGRDEVSNAYYRALLTQGKNWYDHLSSNDLFNMFCLQNSVLSNFHKVEKLNLDNALKSVYSSKTSEYFDGKLEFTGRPKMLHGEKKVDATRQDIRETVLLESSLRAFEKYVERTNSQKEFCQEEIAKFKLGEYFGSVAQRYFREKENIQNQIYEMQRDLSSVDDEIAAFDDQGRPLFLAKDKSGKETYYSLANGIYTGQLFGVKDDDYVVIGHTDEGVYGKPTEYSENEEQETEILQTPQEQSNVEPKPQTQQSVNTSKTDTTKEIYGGCEQLSLFDLTK